ncbi:protein kinase family protein [Nocardioides euryhalodurans]|uniref:Protein kinase domain-containing protein n=1 Tax=Nocardioides euryhalodurans TaxID=2518370 RepID=A0A4P7GLZ7_9ACTN|nr:protein kinase family protein [Nocardioides euryhalodurans]QBR92909.1 hypothetical protein EXE57_11980 [Nocardioides euryhalodurans]
MTQAARPGDVLADRYRLVDLLNESGNGRFWRAHDRVLDRHVALHCIADDDDRAPGLTEAARLSATVLDRRLLRVLDADQRDGMSYVVNEWGAGTSLDILLPLEGPLPPRRAAWIVSEVAASIAVAHEQRVAHGRLVPENVLIDHSGSVRVIGCCVDAALRGLPAGRVSDDVTDLGGLLYYTLTGKWAGSSTSEVPVAPQAQGHWLRPRQVRAGIPRVLDAICDQVLNPFAASPSSSRHNLHTAAGLADALHDYVGDPTGMVQASPLNGVHGAGALAVPERRPPERRPPDPEATQAMASPEPEPEPETEPEAPGVGGTERDDVPADTGLAPTLATPAVPPAAPPTPAGGTTPADAPAPLDDDTADQSDPVDQPTQAGMPIFDDEEDEVSWFSARQGPPPPPPPLEDPPERPLFAPEPEDGGPARRPRPGAATPGQPDYWPWDTATGAAAGTGSGVIPVTEDSDDEDAVPGRSWIRLAALIGVSLLLLVAVVIAYNLGRGKTPLGAEPEPDSPSPTQATEEQQPLQDLEIAGARDLDPQGDPAEENSDSAPLAVDGDPATTWPTSTYDQQFGPGGLKTGVGLVVDLGYTQEVAEIDLTTVGAPTGVTYYVTDEDPAGVGELEPVGSGTVGGDRLRTTLEEPASGQYLVVWLTSLPAVSDGFRGEVAEVAVRG